MIPLNEYRDGAEVAVTVAAAAKVGVFAALADGPATAVEVATRASLDLRATRIVLGALASFGFLVERDGRWTPTDECRRRLVDQASEEFAGGGLPLWLDNLRMWTLLPDVLRSGRRPEPDPSRESERGLADFLAGMAAAPAERVERLVARCLARRPGARTLLDLGGGPGHIATAFVRAGLVTTMVEHADTVAFAAKAYGLAAVEGLHLVAADFMDDPLPRGPFDIVLLSNITHMYSAERNRHLLAKAHAELVPGGLVAIQDFVRGWRGRAERFAIVMLMRTDEGDTYAEADYRHWLAAAGFTGVETEDVDFDRQLVTARKAGRFPGED